MKWLIAYAVLVLLETLRDIARDNLPEIELPAPLRWLFCYCSNVVFLIPTLYNRLRDKLDD